MTDEPQDDAQKLPTASSDDTGRAARRWRLLAGVLALVAVGALVALAVVWNNLAEERELSTAEADARAAAEKAVVAMTSYDYATVDEDFAWVEDAGTSEFQEQYAAASEPVKRLVVNLKAHAEGEVVDSAATAIDTEHVTVLLFVDQEITNEGAAQPTVDQPRVVMEMVLDDGRWLVDEVAIRDLTGGAAGPE